MLIDNATSRLLTGHYRIIGLVFLASGIYPLFRLQWLQAVLSLLISWFLFATYSGVEINRTKGIFREYNCWFGLFKTGQWKNIDNFLGLTLVSMNQVYRVYSRSNRMTASSKKTFQIYFVNKNKRPAISIKKCQSRQQAQTAMDELAIWLKLPVFSIKKPPTR